GVGHALLAGELVERVERQELQAVAAVELLKARDVVHGRDSGSRPLVAVVARRAERAVAAHRRVVAGRRGDADRGDARCDAESLAETAAHAPVQRHETPLQAARGLDGLVEEAADGLHLDGSVDEAADDDAAAGCTEVDGGY